MVKSTKEIKKAFFSSIKRGTGESYLLLKANPQIDFSPFIIQAALKNYALDGQCEGSRAKFIYSLIKIAGQKENIIYKIIEALPDFKSDSYSLDQICDLAVIFHRLGYTEVREALIERAFKSFTSGYEPGGLDQLIELFGLKGLLMVAEISGKDILDNNSYTDSWRVDEFQKSNSQIDIYDLLKRKGKRNPYVKAYHDSIVEHSFQIAKGSKAQKLNYEDIKAKIEQGRFRYISSKAANRISKKDVEKLALDFLSLTNGEDQEPYLIFFRKREFPFSYKSILQILEKPKLRGKGLWEYALGSLRFFKAREIREIAVNGLKERRNASDFLPLFESNYKKGDWKLLIELIQRSDDENFIHSLSDGFENIYLRNKVKESRYPLEVLYNKMTCGICRESIVRVMIQNKVLPKKISEELKYDSYEGVRRLNRLLKVQ